MDPIDRINITPYSSTQNVVPNSSINNLVNQLNRETPNAFTNQFAGKSNEILTGEIIDLKPNEIIVRLNDGTNVSAQIYDTSTLSIGQIIKFHLNNQKGVLVLEPIKDNITSDLVTKALESAHLPINDKNVAIVNELLKHNMPLDSKSINNIIQQSNINKDINVETLVLMNKHDIPVSEDNAAQISKYQNYEHRLIKEIHNIATDVPKLLASLSKDNNVETLVALNNKLVNILTNNKSTHANEILQNNILSTDSSNSNILNNASISDVTNGLTDSLANTSTSATNKVLDNSFTNLIPKDIITTNESTSYPSANLPGVADINKDLPLINNSLDRLTSVSMLSGDVTSDSTTTVTSVYNANPDVASAYLKPSSAHDLTTILEPYNVPEDVMHGIKDGTAPLRVVADEIRKAMEIADEIDDYRVSDYHASQRGYSSVEFGTVSPRISKEMGIINNFDRLDSTNTSNISSTDANNIQNNSSTPRNQPFTSVQSNDYVNLTLAKDAFEHPVVQNILNEYTVLQRDNSEIASFQNFYNRGQLTSKLRDIPNSSELADRIWKGNISANDLLVEVKNLIADENVDSKTIIKILGSDQYQSVMKEAIMNNWTISPNSLKQKDIVKDTYDNMYKQLDDLQSLINKLPIDKSASESLSKELAGTKSNINFMNTINNMFSYVQLPLKLREQNIHSDLYVMTNKKKLQSDKSNLNVLLHLDMQYLGSMDININLSGNVVTSKFHVTDEYTLELLTKNMEQLEYALLEKGFLFSSNVSLKEKEVNLINDFLASDTPSTSIKRYTFDMRG